MKTTTTPSLFSKLVILFIVAMLCGCYGGYGRTCFPAGTMIATPSGSVPIEDLQEGDKVVSYDLNSDTEVVGRVVKTFVHEDAGALYRLRLSDGQDLIATGDHKLYLKEKNGWASAANIKVGQTLLQRSEGEKLKELKVESVQIEGNDAPVYNIDVRAPNETITWFAEGILTRWY